MEVGIRDLRDQLSRHLASVKEGRTVTITDHGKVFAEIVPIGTPDPLERLIREGVVTPAVKRGDWPEPVKGGGTVSDLVAEQRR